MQKGEDSLFDFQLDLIKTEISQIQEIIGRIDILTQQVKYWTILVWTGSISLIIGNSDTHFRQLISSRQLYLFSFGS